MILANREGSDGAGWCVGPWNSAVPIAIGFSGKGVDELHVHDAMVEVYLVARGTATIVVDSASVAVRAGTVLVVEPGETHTFSDHSDDYLHFVVQAPFVSGDKRSVAP
ncbi:MAG: cupin domain-containing protein [Acidimicrobiia bacterium]|nr:cupin domain-containing protein [Acidimicrobiia bacterium]